MNSFIFFSCFYNQSLTMNLLKIYVFEMVICCELNLIVYAINYKIKVKKKCLLVLNNVIRKTVKEFFLNIWNT